VGQNSGPQTDDHSSVKSYPISILFSLEDSLVNLQLKGYKKSRRTLHMCDMLLHYLVTETAKQAINDNLQGSVAACLRCGGVDNNHIKKGLLLTLE